MHINETRRDKMWRKSNVSYPITDHTWTFKVRRRVNIGRAWGLFSPRAWTPSSTIVLLATKTTSNTNQETTHCTWVSSRSSLLQDHAKKRWSRKNAINSKKKFAKICFCAKKWRRPDALSESAFPHVRTQRFCCKKKTFLDMDEIFLFQRFSFFMGDPIQHMSSVEREALDERSTSSMITVPVFFATNETLRNAFILIPDETTKIIKWVLTIRRVLLRPSQFRLRPSSFST